MQLRSSTTVARINVADIVLADEAQPRAHILEQIVTEYQRAMEQGDQFPPIAAFCEDTSGPFYLADGFHRVLAARRLGVTTMDAHLESGALREAILYSVAANAAHGLRRTNEDKRRAVGRLLGDSEWRRWTDREIARACKVTHPFVGKLRKLQEAEAPGGVRQFRRKGVVRLMRTASIGNRRKGESYAAIEERLDGIEDAARRVSAETTNRADPFATLADILDLVAEAESKAAYQEIGALMLELKGLVDEVERISDPEKRALINDRILMRQQVLDPKPS